MYKRQGIYSDAGYTYYYKHHELRVTKPCGVEEKRVEFGGVGQAELNRQFNHELDAWKYATTNPYYYKTKKENTVRTLSPQAKKNMDPNLVLVLEELTTDDDALDWRIPEVKQFQFDTYWATHKEELVAAAKAARAKREEK